MKRVVGVYISLALILIVSACTNQLATINVETGNTETVHTQEKKDSKSYEAIVFKELKASNDNSNVELVISLENNDNFEVNSLIINSKTYSEFNSNYDNTQITINFSEGLYIGEKTYELEAIEYGNEEIQFVDFMKENNKASVKFDLFLNNFEFLQLPQYPMDYVRLTAGFRSQSYYNLFGVQHNGIDLGGIDGSYGNEGIYSIADGEVVYFSNSSTAGKYVVVKHDNLIKNQTVITRYLHLDRYEHFTIGEMVQKGQLIGIEGETGKVDGAHLHFEMWVTPPGYDYRFTDITQYAVDPIEYLFVHDYQEVSGRSIEKDHIKVVK